MLIILKQGRRRKVDLRANISLWRMGRCGHMSPGEQQGEWTEGCRQASVQRQGLGSGRDGRRLPGGVVWTLPAPEAVMGRLQENLLQAVLASLAAVTNYWRWSGLNNESSSVLEARRPRPRCQQIWSDEDPLPGRQATVFRKQKEWENPFSPVFPLNCMVCRNDLS